ncbi:MAG: hypothetical protein ACRYFX_10425 [Janthinobacterium lividum]
MKTSTKYLLAALLVLLASLTAYNMALRTEYHKGTYKDPLRDYATLTFKDFDAIEIPAASLLQVKIVAGPYAVRLNPKAKEYVHLTQQGRRLIITAAFPEKREYLGWGETVVVSCPRLTELHTDGTYQLKGKAQFDKADTRGNIQVQGFRQDSLALQANRATSIGLTGNKLGYLRATLGTTPGSQTSLALEVDNHIAAATLAMQHQSKLTVNNLAIADIHWQFADSAKAELTGAALRMMQK